MATTTVAASDRAASVVKPTGNVSKLLALDNKVGKKRKASISFEVGEDVKRTYSVSEGIPTAFTPNAVDALVEKHGATVKMTGDLSDGSKLSVQSFQDGEDAVETLAETRKLVS